MLHRRWLLLAKIAKVQFGVVSMAQLMTCGFSADGVERATRAGQLFRIHRGVYSVGFPPTDPNALWMAAALSCGPDAAVSHRSAGEASGLLRLRTGPVDVSIPDRSGRRRRGVRIHRPRFLPLDEVTQIRRIPCTTPSRTILDIAGQSRGRETEWAIEAAEGLGVLDLVEIERLLDRHSRRRGNAKVRGLLGLHDEVPVFTRSVLERRMYRLCRGNGIDLPKMNVRITTSGGRFEVDCLWPDERLIVECDSHRWHDNPISADQDALRDQALTLAGWRVVRMRWVQIVREPEQTARTISLVLEQQRKLLS